MAQMPLTDLLTPRLVSSLWFSFDPAEDDKELLALEQEVAADLARVEQRHCETIPVGKPEGNEGKASQPNPVLVSQISVIPNQAEYGLGLQNFFDDTSDEEEEEDNDDVDEESDSHDDDIEAIIDDSNFEIDLDAVLRDSTTQ